MVIMKYFKKTDKFPNYLYEGNEVRIISKINKANVLIEDVKTKKVSYTHMDALKKINKKD